MDFIDYFFLVTVSQFLLIGLIIGTISLNKRFRKWFFIYIKEFWKRAFNITGQTKRNEFLIVQGFLLLKLILLEYFVFCLYLDIAVFPDLAYEMGCKVCLISAKEPKLEGDYNKVILNVDEYHTSEVLTLSLFYQLIHGSGFTCPSINDSLKRNEIDDYKFTEKG